MKRLPMMGMQPKADRKPDYAPERAPETAFGHAGTRLRQQPAPPRAAPPLFLSQFMALFTLMAKGRMR